MYFKVFRSFTSFRVSLSFQFFFLSSVSSTRNFKWFQPANPLQNKLCHHLKIHKQVLIKMLNNPVIYYGHYASRYLMTEIIVVKCSSEIFIVTNVPIMTRLNKCKCSFESEVGLTNREQRDRMIFFNVTFIPCCFLRMKLWALLILFHLQRS